MSKRHDWKPIAEMSDDDADVVVIDLRKRQPHLELFHTLDSAFNPGNFTHFIEVPKLTTEHAKRLIAAMGGSGK